MLSNVWQARIGDRKGRVRASSSHKIERSPGLIKIATQTIGHGTPYHVSTRQLRLCRFSSMLQCCRSLTTTAGITSVSCCSCWSAADTQLFRPFDHDRDGSQISASRHIISGDICNSCRESHMSRLFSLLERATWAIQWRQIQSILPTTGD